MNYRTDLILGKDFCLFIFFHFPDSVLSLLTGLHFYFSWRDTENTELYLFLITRSYNLHKLLTLTSSLNFDPYLYTVNSLQDGHLWDRRKVSVLERCPSYKESNKGNKQWQGPTLGVRFTEVSVI